MMNKPIALKDNDRINTILSAVNLFYKKAGMVYLLLILLIAIVYPLGIRSSLSYWFMFAMIIVNGIPGVINFYFQRKYRTFLETIGDNYILINLGTITSVATSILKIVMLQMGVSILVVQTIYCCSSLVQMIYVYYYTKKKYPWIDFSVKPDHAALKQKNAALIHQICGLVTGSTDVVVLSLFCDLRAVSIYTVYNMVFNIVCTSVQSVNSGLQYMLGQAFCRGKDYYKRIIDTYETFYITLATCLMFVCYICIVPFLKLYTAGADINYIGNLLPLLFMLVKVMDALRNASLNTIYVSGNFNTTQKYAIVETLINVVVSVLSVFKFGLSGALCGTLVAYVYRTFVAVRYANIIILKDSCKHSIRTFLINGVLLCLMCFVGKYIVFEASNYILFFAKALVITLISVLVFFGVNAFGDREAVKLIYPAVKNKIYTRIGKRQ